MFTSCLSGRWNCHHFKAAASFFFQKNGCIFNHHLLYGKLWIYRCEANNHKKTQDFRSFASPASSHVPCFAGIMALFPGMVMRMFVSLGPDVHPPKKRWSGFPQGPNCGKPGNFLWGVVMLHRFIWFEWCKRRAEITTFVCSKSGSWSYQLGGGLKYFLFSPLPGEDFQFD